MKIKNKIFFYTLYSLLVIFIFLTNSFAAHVPETPGSPVIESEGNFRLFIKKNNFNLLTEAKGRIEDEDNEFRYHSLTIGPYYRLHRNIKIGLFYRLQRGVWHDDDWINTTDGWEWRDTNSRNEHVFVGDLTPRFKLSFLPGTNWIFDTKTRYLYNTFNDNQTVKIRPGITYFYIKDLEPIINFSVQYELYFPINYGVSTIYEKWLYLSSLYHINSSLKFGLFFAYKTVTWGASKDFKEMHANEDEYNITYKAYVFGINLIYRFSL